MKTTVNNVNSLNSLVKDSIIIDYIKYIKYLEDRKYNRESITIYENLSSLVTINNLKANNEGIILDIMCPPGRIISIHGIKSYPENYHIEKIPPFEIRLADHNGEEIDPETKIKILKNKILRKSEEICNILYKDISITNFSKSPNKFKSYVELYRFDRGIELKGEDHLKIYAINPNIDINNIKFNLGTDIWTPI